MTSNSKSDQECCPKFEPNLWDDKIFEWENKKFIKDKVLTFLYMPLNFGNAMRRFDKKLTHAGIQNPDALCLSDHTSPWNMDLYLAVDQEIPDTENTVFNGRFYSKVYEGPFQNTGKWTKDFETITKSKGITYKKMYMWYTTCPKCAKKYGKNYVVIIGQVI